METRRLSPDPVGARVNRCLYHSACLPVATNTTYVGVTSSFDHVTETYIACPLGNSTATATGTFTDYEHSTTTTIATGPTVTAHTACKANNVATAFPTGGGFTTTDYFTNNLSRGPALVQFQLKAGSFGTAETCCNVCHSLLICYGSLWQVGGNNRPNGTCYTLVAASVDPDPVCNASSNALTCHNYCSVHRGRSKSRRAVSLAQRAICRVEEDANCDRFTLAMTTAASPCRPLTTT